MPSEKYIYEIRVKGHLDDDWSSWFEDFRISRVSGKDGSPVTMLSGVIGDQAALHGLLIKLRDIGVSIISVNSIDGEKGGEK